MVSLRRPCPPSAFPRARAARRLRAFPAALLPLALGAILLAGCAGTGKAGGGRGRDASSEHTFDRAGFGTSGLPIWMGLTPREIRALAGKDRAAASDASALLDLAIFASGFPRDAAGYDSIHARVEAFARQARPEVERQRTLFAKGKALHDAMHEEFLSAPRSRGYEFDQSALSALFTERRFNCISSALLYVVLARRFGLEVQGVLMPSHAFVQIVNPGAQAIEVETTSPASYGAAHDREFYARKAPGWFRDRNLAPGTYEDYLKRRIVSPLHLVAENMGHQHTDPSRMGAEDRCRVWEARAYLDPDHPVAQHNRLVVWQNEYMALSREKDFAAVAALHAVARPHLVEVARRFPRDTGLGRILGQVWQGHAYAFAMLGRGPEALDAVDAAWALDEAAGPSPAGRANLLASVQNLAVGEAEAGRFAEAESILERYAGRAGADPGYRKTRAWLQSAWAADHWNRKDWQQAVARFERQLATGGADTAQVEGNIEAAYINWAIARQEADDREGARSRLRACRERLPRSAECRARLDRLMADSP